MAKIYINCLVVDDYSHEDIFKIEINEHDTVENLVKTINKMKIGFYGFKLLKVDLPLKILKDKLAHIEEFSTDIRTFLEGEELFPTKVIPECFNNGNYHVVIIPPSGCLTFKKCVHEKNLIIGDKIIYHDINHEERHLKGTIVNVSNRLKIKCNKVHTEHYLDSFSEFIKLAIFLYEIEGKD